MLLSDKYIDTINVHHKTSHGYTALAAEVYRNGHNVMDTLLGLRKFDFSDDEINNAFVNSMYGFF